MSDYGRFSNPMGAAPERVSNPFRGSGQRSTGVVNIDQLAAMFGLPSWDKIEEMNQDYIWESARGAETEEAQQKAEEEASAELYNKWHDAVESAAENLFGLHGLDLVAKGKGDRAYEYKIEPKQSWQDAARQIVNTINGVGYFHFNTTKEFLDSGPWTAREAVLEHLGYIKRYSDVYGSDSAKSRFEAAWR